MTWYLKASCRGMDTKIFFPSDDERTAMRRKRERQAKDICARCVVVEECLKAGEFEDGIWGGLTRAERLGASRHRVPLERPMAIAEVENESPWVIIETSGNYSIWQRDSDATWHGAEWAVVEKEQILKVFDDLNNAYTSYGHLLHS